MRRTHRAVFLVVAALALVADLALTPDRTWSLALGVAVLGSSSGIALHVARRWRSLRGGDAAVAGRARELRAVSIEAFAVLLLLLFIYAKGRLLVEVALRVGPSRALAPANTAYGLALAGAASVALLARTRLVESLAAAVVARPARLMIGSFVIAIVTGTLLLTLPVAVAELREVSLVDAIFTATSAVCVTGLSVNDVGTTYTRVGHVVIMALVQVGGLGIMTLGATAAAFAGRRLRIQDSASMAEILDADSIASARQLIRRIVITTVVVELCGTALLYASLRDDPRAGGEPLFYAAFHAVSAFCNAGISLSAGGLAPYAASPAVSATLCALVVLGGLGFPVIDDLIHAARERLHRRRRRLSLTTRAALVVSLALTLGGAALLGALEWSASFAALPWHHRIASAMYHSIATRSAGFLWVDLGAARPATLMLIMGLMFVGASPASMGGGVKTTTLAIFFAAGRSLAQGRARTELFGRTLPQNALSRAIAVTSAAAAIVTAATFVLLLLEPHEPLRLMLEACSAFCTAGMSTGLTASLGAPAKLVLAAVMLAGRTGPLTLALALADGPRHQPITYPEERILVG